MASHIRGYLRDVGRHLHLGQSEQSLILFELQAHIEDKTNDLIDSGVPSDEALDGAISSMGASEGVAQQLYEVHTRGSWYHTALAVLPHVLLALMFAFGLWSTPIWVTGMLVVAMAITVVGWRQGRPRWTYPWLGYCLVTPIVSWALAMSAVGYGAWQVVITGTLPHAIPLYLISFAYIAVSMWVVIRIVSKVARPDWVMASLAILPIPFLAFWFYFFYNGGQLFKLNAQPLHDLDNSAAIVFLIVAAATAVFFRIGRRVVRVALLLITAPSVIILAWLSYHGGKGYFAVFRFALFSLIVLLSPALFERKKERADQLLEFTTDPE